MNKHLILFFLALFAAIFSVSQIVNLVKSDFSGFMLYFQIIVFFLLFLVSMFLLVFGMYASEKARGRITRKVSFFENLLGKEK